MESINNDWFTKRKSLQFNFEKLQEKFCKELLNRSPKNLKIRNQQFSHNHSHRNSLNTLRSNNDSINIKTVENKGYPLLRNRKTERMSQTKYII